MRYLSDDEISHVYGGKTIVVTNVRVGRDGSEYKEYCAMSNGGGSRYREVSCSTNMLAVIKSAAKN